MALSVNGLPNQVALFVNADSRKGGAKFDDARRLLGNHRIEVVRAELIDDPDRFGEAIHTAVTDSIPMIVVGGGDGSLLKAVPNLIGSDAVLGVLPLGTANSFARSLELPLDLEDAIGVIATGRPRRVDLGRIGENLYAGCASIGLAPQIAQTVPHGLKAWAGRPGYLMWAAAQLARFQAFELTVEDERGSHRLEAVEVRIANGPCHGGVELVERAELDSGRVVVQAVVGQKRRHLVFNWCAHLARSKARYRDLREFEARTLKLSTRPSLPIFIDGEVLACTPVLVSAAPGAILVAAPSRAGA